MAIIGLSTNIDAPAERVFDLARSIDAHVASADATGERAVEGVKSGLIGLGDEVTWEARHFGIKQRLRVRVTAFDRPHHFQDTMVRGAFKLMIHDHVFETRDGGTLMHDRFEFEAPLGLLGRLVEHLLLTRYMRRFLMRRNEVLKRMAEGQEWQAFLD
jgi:ligand-binding SRPBCC domain-containing protein